MIRTQCVVVGLDDMLISTQCVVDVEILEMRDCFSKLRYWLNFHASFAQVHDTMSKLAKEGTSHLQYHPSAAKEAQRKAKFYLERLKKSECAGFSERLLDNISRKINEVEGNFWENQDIMGAQTVSQRLAETVSTKLLAGKVGQAPELPEGAATITRVVLQRVLGLGSEVSSAGERTEAEFQIPSEQQVRQWTPEVWEKNFFRPGLVAVEWLFFYQKSPDLVRTVVAKLASWLPKGPGSPGGAKKAEAFFEEPEGDVDRAQPAGRGGAPQQVGHDPQAQTQQALDIYSRYVAPMASMYEASLSFGGHGPLPEHHATFCRMLIFGDQLFQSFARGGDNINGIKLFGDYFGEVLRQIRHQPELGVWYKETFQGVDAEWARVFNKECVVYGKRRRKKIGWPTSKLTRKKTIADNLPGRVANIYAQTLGVVSRADFERYVQKHFDNWPESVFDREKKPPPIVLFAMTLGLRALSPNAGFNRLENRDKLFNTGRPRRNGAKFWTKISHEEKDNNKPTSYYIKKFDDQGKEHTKKIDAALDRINPFTLFGWAGEDWKWRNAGRVLLGWWGL